MNGPVPTARQLLEDELSEEGIVRDPAAIVTLNERDEAWPFWSAVVATTDQAAQQ